MWNNAIVLGNLLYDSPVGWLGSFLFSTGYFVLYSVWSLRSDVEHCLEHGAAGPVLVSPTHDGVVPGDAVEIVLRECRGGSPAATSRRSLLDDEPVELVWSATPYENQWISRSLSKLAPGHHALTLVGTCDGVDFERRIDFRAGATAWEIAEDVLVNYVVEHPASETEWNWGPAVFYYGLTRLLTATTTTTTDDESFRARYYADYAASYYDRFASSKKTLVLETADLLAPALGAWWLDQYRNESRYESLIDAVSDRVRDAPRNVAGCLNHLGEGAWSLLASVIGIPPESIWVDSLVMWVLLPVERWGRADDDDADDVPNFSFASEQLSVFADRLFDDDAGLFYHAWDVNKERLYPEDNVPWLRGNGWAAVFLVQLLEALDRRDDPTLAALRARAEEILVALATAAAALRDDGSSFWDTVMAEPGAAYEETSGSVLIAYALAKGRRLGILTDDAHRVAARNTFAAAASRSVRRARTGGSSVTGISEGTNPGDRRDYALMRTFCDLPYGVGAFLLLATEMVEGGDFVGTDDGRRSA